MSKIIQMKSDSGENLYPITAVESGSNSKGHWIKYSDGTLIQYGEIKQSANTSSAISGIGGYRSSGFDFIFPIEFVSKPPSVVASTSGGLIDNGILLANDQITKRKFQLLWWSVSSNSTVQDHYATWQAIGRWK